MNLVLTALPRPRCQTLPTEYILELFGPSNRDANYRDFMADGIDIATGKFYADLGW
jgi:hypothetical protein